MGSQQQFCLRWNNHQSNMLSVFDDLFQNEALVDVTLACDGLSIKAHKMVLSACSPYFQNLFLDNPCKHPIVILKDIRFTDLKALMDFMYKGEVNVSQEQLSTLLRTAETLKVRGLTEVAGGSNDPLHNSLLLPPPSTSSAAAQQHSQQPTQGAQMTHQQPSQGASSQHQLPRPNGTVQSSSSVNASSLNQHQRPSSSPSPKRKKVRHRPSSGGNFGQSGVGEPSSSQSDYEDSGDSRSHELIEPKVEIMEDCVEGGEEVVQRSSNSKDGQGKGGLLRHGKTAAASQGTAMNNEFAANNSNNTQGVPSSQEASPTNDAQTFTSRAGNVTMNATPPVLFSQPTPPTSLASIGQPPVLQGTSQVYVVRSCCEGDVALRSVAESVVNPATCAGLGGKKPKGGRPTILYEEEEEDIVTFINHQAVEGMPVDFKQILAYGNGLLRRQGRRPTGNMYCDPSKGLSVKWWRGFKKRHPGLPYLRLK